MTPITMEQILIDATYRRPYRRHAAVTPLELRGAKAILSSALKHIVSGVNNSYTGMNSFAAYSILWDARLKIVRELEKL